MVDVPEAQAGRLFRAGIAFVALNIEKVVLSMERTISEHEKLTPRNTIFGHPDSCLDFLLEFVSNWAILQPKSTIQVLRLLNFCLPLLFLQDLFFSKCRTKWVE